MRRIRSSILILGLFIVAFLNLQTGFNFHKALAHPVGDNAVAVYQADPSSKTPAIAVRIRGSAENESIETHQKVNVYLFYSYEDQKSATGLAVSVLIVIVATFTLYFSTYLLSLIKSK